MKRYLIAALFTAAFLSLVIFSPVKSDAGVDVNISIPLPELVLPVPPALVVIPGTYAYTAPDVDVDIFFYHGFWYRPYGGQWYIADEYNGPWRFVAVGRVPRVLIDLPSGHRRLPPGYERVPYGQVRRNWQTWERERYWENEQREREHFREHREHHGRGRGMGRHRDDDDDD
ncbi:MAG TPA: hypothetical protein VF903_12480 [Nitrospirota bacterium]